MTPKALAMALIVVGGILMFIAVERYANNASNVQAMNSLGFGGLVAPGGMKPATPTVSIYCGLFGVMAAVGGAVALISGGKKAEPKDG